MAAEAQVMAMAKNVGDVSTAFTGLTRIAGPPDNLITVALQRWTFAATLYPCARWTGTAPSAMWPLNVMIAKLHTLAQEAHQAVSIFLKETLTHHLGAPRTVERTTQVSTAHSAPHSWPARTREVASLELDVKRANAKRATLVDHARTYEQWIRSCAE